MISKLISPDAISETITDYYKSGGPKAGLDTGWHSINEFLKLDKGLLCVVTGIPSSGKSEWLDQLMLFSIAAHKWHWTVFSPENWPLAQHFQKLAEKWTGKPMFPGYKITPMSPAELVNTIGEMKHGISFVRPSESEMNLDGIMAILKQSVDENGTNAFVLDPWNEVEHIRPPSMSETEYIGQCLTKLRNFARLHLVTIFVVAHPTKLCKDDDGNYPVPTPYDISGSANWRNKADVCIAVWRDYQKNDGMVDVHIQKVRNKNLGTLGHVTLKWERANGIFYDQDEDITGDLANGVRGKISK